MCPLVRAGIVSGGQIQPSITYNSSMQNLSVHIIDPTAPEVYTVDLSRSVNMTEHLPEWVTVGFSAATKATSELHTLYSWEFSSNLRVNEIAKLGDFGLGRLADHAKGVQTIVLTGTIGYMAPKCFYTGKTSKESDVNSFGIVFLEIANEKRVVDSWATEGQVGLLDWVWELYGILKLVDTLDPKLGRDFNEN
ncbi:L-type lectin-domain containing receptor kinase IX.1-like [Eucalyptus grandis]|uniref:L-type lectin-domain containing receptor kinase IX.1-like n=1 Tax=Eucalyptus grandis TaxID=71139 RepID=UPI00192EDB85|nr:L-type lectin-domain containing receptor kinase IX.1-like [Eucalyptus grandis]